MFLDALTERVSLLDVALICPMLITLGWAIPNLSVFSKKALSNRMMGLFMLNMFLFFLACNSLYFASYRLFLFLDPLFMFTLTAILPILLLYLKVVIDADHRVQFSDLYHFIPSFIFLLSSASVYLLLMSPEQKQYYVYNCILQKCTNQSGLEAIIFLNQLNKIFFSLQTLVYLFIFIRLIKRHSQRLKNHYSNLTNLKIQWAYLFLGTYFIAVAVGVPAIFGGHQAFRENDVLLIVTLLILSCVFYLVAWVDTSQLMIPVCRAVSDSDYSRAQVYFDQNQLRDNLLGYFQNEKPYLNKDLKIEDVQLVLKTNRTYISQLINNEFKTNFCMFVNRFRVGEAKGLLLKEENRNLTNEYIGQQSGFGTYHSFIQAFRYFEDTTPARFRKKHFQENELTEV